MNSRERVIRAIERRTPDRVPLTHATLPGAVALYGAALQELYARFPSDVANVGAATSGEYGPQVGVPSRDTWCSLWVRYTGEHKGQIVQGPLEDWDAMVGFEPPDTSSAALLAAIQERLDANTTQGDAKVRYTMADGDILWQRMFYVHGYQATLQDLLLYPERCADLRDMILAVMVRRVECLCRFRALDGIHFRDDWGTQQALMIRPELWRQFFKPAYARLFALARDAGKHVWFHSDGAIGAIIPDLIEIGVQVINPQVDLVGRATLTALCRGKICIQADIDRQWVLPYGRPQDVRAAVRSDIEVLGSPEGGYIGRGEAAGDVPLANLEALLDEVTSYRAVGRP